MSQFACLILSMLLALPVFAGFRLQLGVGGVYLHLEFIGVYEWLLPSPKNNIKSK